MKRLLCLTLALVVLGAWITAACAEESGMYTFECSILKAINETPTSWCSSSESRALFVVLMCLEYGNSSQGANFGEKADFLTPCFVCRDDSGSVWAVIHRSGGGWTNLIYNYYLDQNFATELDADVGSSIMKSVLNQQFSSVYEVETLDILAALNTVKEAFE